MDGSEVLVMILSMLTSAVLGAVGMLFFGGRTALNYLGVKVSRGRKVLLFGKTSFGWKSFVASKKGNELTWKFDGNKKTTTIEEGSLSRYARVDCVFVDTKKPERTLGLKEDSIYPEDFDAEVFNNILIRAQTRPSVDGNDDIKKMLTIALILLVGIVFGVIMIYVKFSEFASAGVI